MENKNIPFYDMHTHSQNSQDSDCPVKDMALSCIKKGICAFAVTDHCNMQDYEKCNMPLVIENSYKEAQREAESFEGRIKILKGIELGEAIWDEKAALGILESHKFDAVIGSVHVVRCEESPKPYSQMIFSEIPEEKIRVFLDKYFDELLLTVKTVPCDIAAHLTCPLRYINGKYGIGIDSHDYADKINEILAVIVKNGIALELNTSGVSKNRDDFLPDEWIVENYRKTGGRLITIGTDAHIAKNAGNGFDKAITLLKKLGFTEYHYYENRKPKAVKL